jgi:hypothetical protein
MKLSELLSHLAATVLDDRAAMLNGAADQLWSDTYLVRLLNDAQRILCRRAWVLEDEANATAGTIQLVQNQRDYALHKSVVRVLSARLSDSQVDLDRVPYDLSRPQASSTLPDFFPPELAYSDQPGRPRVFATDVATRVLRVRFTPDADAAALQVLMRVSRTPLVWLDTSLPNADPEIAEDHHLALTDYAAGEALSIPAADANLRAVGKDYRVKWAQYVREQRQERERAEMSVVQWKFGGGIPRG